MSPMTTLELMGVDYGVSLHGLRHLPILREGQSHFLSNTIRTTYAMLPSLHQSRIVTRTRQHDNLSFRTLRMRKQFVVR